jgi:myxalamid-type polyketide synthase MxaE and MxaD
VHDLCYTASARRSHHPYRLAVTGRTASELAARLADLLSGESPRAARRQPRIVLVFSGQGSQWTGMGHTLYKSEPIFRTALDEIAEEMRRCVDWSLADALFGPHSEQMLGRIDVVQPTLFAIQVALAALWRSWGIKPDAVVGHSMGEVAAAHVAGALSLPDAVRVICMRSALMHRLSGHGTMASIDLSPDEIRLSLDGLSARIAIAVNNSPTSTVVSGDVEAILLYFAARGAEVRCRPLKVDVAAHSPHMDS